MHYLARCCLISLFLNLALPTVLQAQSPACLEQGKQEFAAQKYNEAKTTFNRCLLTDPKNEEVLLSLAGVCLSQDELACAKKYFLESLKQQKRTSPYLSYTYSMLGDIALKEQDNQAALAYYNKSLSYNEAYVNSLVGKGVITDNMGDKKAAARIYQTALAVEPLNLVARKRLIVLEPVYFSDEEMLDALKQRHAISPEQKTLEEKDRALFGKIHRAEQRNGITYLKEKFGNVPEEYVVTLYKDTPFAREILTLKGYTTLQKQIAQDAIAVFQKAGINVEDTFALRDLKGEKIFLPDNTLTESGLAVYQAALQGKRKYMLPSEELPLTSEQIAEINAVREQLKQGGYTEITAQELAYLRQETNCSLDTMQNKLGLYVLPVSRFDTRYYVIAHEVTDPKKGALWHYVAKLRSATNHDIIVPKNRLVREREWMNFKLCNSGNGDLYRDL